MRRSEKGRAPRLTCSVRLFEPFRAVLSPEARRACVLPTLHRDQRVPCDVAQDALRRAIRLSHDPSLGLRAAILAREETFDVLEYIVRSAPTLLAGAESMRRYLRIMHDGAEMSLRVDDGAVALTCRVPTGDDPHGQVAEFMLASLFLCMRRAHPAAPAVSEVYFRHAAPSCLDLHEEVFGRRPRFGQANDLFILPLEDMQRALPGADSVLHDILVRAAQSTLGCGGTALTVRVKEQLVAELRGGTPTLDHVAAMLGMSSRSLNRRLAEEQTTFRALLEELRQQLALRYLDQRELSLSEISFLLGFSHVAAFHRAFRRWQRGLTPSAYRAQQTDAQLSRSR